MIIEGVYEHFIPVNWIFDVFSLIIIPWNFDFMKIIAHESVHMCSRCGS